MKALSIKQPWANLIVNGSKDIENRKWNTKFRGRFLVHASKEIDEEAMELLGNKDELYPTGCVIGSVELVDVVFKSESQWFHGPKGFVLRHPEKLTPFKLKGKLGFFEVNQEVMK